MNKRPMAAALLLPLVFTAPVQAQGPADVRSDTRAIPGPSYSPARESRTAYLPMRDGGTGFSLSTHPIIQDDGSAVYRKTLVGSVRMAPNVTLGVGLVEITRTSHKERALSRIRPMSDTEGRSDRIAAVGLSFSF